SATVIWDASRGSVQHRDHAAVTVYPHPLPRRDPPGGLAGADYRGHAVLARHDGRVRHGAADVGDGGLDLAEDRPPAGRGHRADEDLPVPDLADLVDVTQHPGGALDDAAGRAVAAHFPLVAGGGL